MSDNFKTAPSTEDFLEAVEEAEKRGPNEALKNLLAAPQGQRQRSKPLRQTTDEQLQKAFAKEGEEDGATAVASDRGDCSDSGISPTPGDGLDIAGLVERLRVANKANFSDLCEEVADALERMVGEKERWAKDAQTTCKTLRDDCQQQIHLARCENDSLERELTAAKATIENREQIIERLQLSQPFLYYENKLLREALEKVDRKVTKAIDGDNPEIFQGLIEDCQTIARAALNAKD